ncbi:glycosyltransferase, partial [Candidatus Woesearchaeota archaeon]|nr:glycosyltransferase [Candidatus Woesearchaeota archaeon]
MHGDEKKVSVVILAYNEESTIKRTINSLLHQTQKPFEIILINDGSTDNTLKKAKKFKNKIRIINKKINQGRAWGYSKGFNTAKGDIVAYLDGDAFAPKNWIKELKKGFTKRQKNIACVGGYYLGYNTKNQITKLENKYNQIAAKLGLFKLPSGTNMAYDKKICEKLAVFKNLPRFRCDKYAMDLLIKNKQLIEIINFPVYAKMPETVYSYIKQRFRWGRGMPSAGLINKTTLFKKVFVLLLPLIAIPIIIKYPRFFFDIVLFCFLFFLIFNVIISIKWKLYFVEAIHLIIL